jgi:APA family basic amino acid/polyamine antiporter
MTLAFCISLLVQRPQYSWPGLIIVALGVPVYFAWRRIGRGPAAAEEPAV